MDAPHRQQHDIPVCQHPVKKKLFKLVFGARS
jgi:hypothetical protein